MQHIGMFPVTVSVGFLLVATFELSWPALKQAKRSLKKHQKVSKSNAVQHSSRLGWVHGPVPSLSAGGLLDFEFLVLNKVVLDYVSGYFDSVVKPCL